MEEAYLTNNGNLMRFHPMLEKFYFQKPDGTFLREIHFNEEKYLKSVCLKIQGNFQKHPEFFPQWEFLKSVLVVTDDSEYRDGLSNNGGCYSFSTYEDWFVAKMPDGEWKFAYVTRFTTSADFGYDELCRRFHQGLNFISVSNVAGGMTYYTQVDEDVVLESLIQSFGKYSTIEDLFLKRRVYYPPNWDDEINDTISEALAFSDKKEILKKLQNLGWSRERRPRRPNRKNIRR